MERLAAPGKLDAGEKERARREMMRCHEERSVMIRPRAKKVTVILQCMRPNTQMSLHTGPGAAVYARKSTDDEGQWTDYEKQVDTA
ncbi:MAG: hypothetical protein IKU38_04345 [Clostridia bacterium]|nr:hypothetical protein [Clostridia bacterium]